MTTNMNKLAQIEPIILVHFECAFKSMHAVKHCFQRAENT